MPRAPPGSFLAGCRPSQPRKAAALLSTLGPSPFRNPGPASRVWRPLGSRLVPNPGFGCPAARVSSGQRKDRLATPAAGWSSQKDAQVVLKLSLPAQTHRKWPLGSFRREAGSGRGGAGRWGLPAAGSVAPPLTPCGRPPSGTPCALMFLWPQRKGRTEGETLSSATSSCLSHTPVSLPSPRGLCRRRWVRMGFGGSHLTPSGPPALHLCQPAPPDPGHVSSPPPAFSGRIRQDCLF